MKKILSVFGTRPEAIKMAPLVKAIEHDGELEGVVCVTAQHREMLDQILNFFDIQPDYDLNIMTQRQTITDVTVKVLTGIENILKEVRPDVVLVHGDTTTTFCAALAAFYQQIPVGHVEAGLRTWNLYSPYPEEFNRQAVGRIAEYHFAPTEGARQNLLKEGKTRNVFVTGNTAIDALKFTVKSDFRHPLTEWAKGKRLILLTAHRRENLGEPMRHMFRAIRRIAEEHDDIRVLYPIHKNPAVRETAHEIFGNGDVIRLVEPMDVFEFQNIMAKSYLVLTDSGGIQEEAPSLGVPVLVMRDTTERPEGIEAGTLRLVGTDEEKIYTAFRELLEDRASYDKMAHAANPYGDGRASARIVEVLKHGSFETVKR